MKTKLLIDKLSAIYAEKGIEALLPQNLPQNILAELIDACSDIRAIYQERKDADGSTQKEVHSWMAIHWLTKAFSDYKAGTQSVYAIPWDDAWDKKIIKLLALYSVEPLRRNKVIDLTALPKIDTIFDTEGGIIVLNEKALNDWRNKQ
jgi:predicted benzoate:H+ symporter BenE